MSHFLGPQLEPRGVNSWLVEVRRRVPPRSFVFPRIGLACPRIHSLVGVLFLDCKLQVPLNISSFLRSQTLKRLQDCLRFLGLDWHLRFPGFLGAPFIDQLELFLRYNLDGFTSSAQLRIRLGGYPVGNGQRSVT